MQNASTYLKCIYVFETIDMQFPLCNVFILFYFISLLFYALYANDKLNTRERQSAMSLLVISTCPARVPFPHGSFI